MSRSEFKKVNSLKIKKYRHIEGLFIAEGEKIINDLISSSFELDLLIVTDLCKNSFFNIDKDKIRSINDIQADKLTALKNPPGCLATFKIPTTNQQPLQTDWVLATDFIQDPGNLGTLIRIADWFGIPYVVCSEDTVDAYNPKVVQASMGSIARVKILYKNLEEWFSEEKRNVYAGTLDGEDIRQIDFNEAGVLLIGNEANGISERLHKHITHSVFIPKKGGAESLNASVAAGIMASFAFLKH